MATASKDSLEIRFPSRREYVGVVRLAISGIAQRCNFTIDEIEDLKIAVTEACTNVIEFYYPEDIALFEREFVAAEQAAYEETAREDAEICERMTAGRRALYLQGSSETGPYQSPMEDGVMHFHEFVRRELKLQL